jgi:hypothetical protein
VSAGTAAPVRPHKAVEYETEDDVYRVRRRECRVCGEPVEGSGPSLRHVGETAAAETPDPKYGESIARAQVLLEQAGIAPSVARDAVLRLYADGLLKQRRSHG